MTADQIQQGAILVAVLPAVLFPVVYGLFMPWYTSVTGRALMTLSTGLAVMVARALLRSLFGADYPGDVFLLVLVYVFVIGGLWLQFGVLMRHLLRRDRDRSSRGL